METFQDIPIGTVFYLHHKDGMKGVKRSTRTAEFIYPSNRLFYVGQKERVLEVRK
jgi:hypothetical protein